MKYFVLFTTLIIIIGVVFTGDGDSFLLNLDQSNPHRFFTLILHKPLQVGI